MDDIDWATGHGLLAVDDPAEVDNAFARNEKHGRLRVHITSPLKQLCEQLFTTGKTV